MLWARSGFRDTGGRDGGSWHGSRAMSKIRKKSTEKVFFAHQMNTKKAVLRKMKYYIANTAKIPLSSKPPKILCFSINLGHFLAKLFLYLSLQ